MARLGLALVSSAAAVIVAWPFSRAWMAQHRAGDSIELHRREMPTPRKAAPEALRTTIYRSAPESDVAMLFTLDPGTVYDRFSMVKRKPNWENRLVWPEHAEGEWVQRTNSLGLREDRELSREQPDLRILIAGDSQTEGVCNNAESFAHVLEGLLTSRALERSTGRLPSIEVVNAGMGGTTFHNYLGVLERFIDLKPDVFVFAVYGGNDFFECLPLHAYFHDQPEPPSIAVFWDTVLKAPRSANAAIAQSVVSLKYFATYPEQALVALEAAREVSAHIRDLCAAHSIRLLCAYIPPLTDVAPQQIEPVYADLCRLLSLEPRDLTSTECLADDYLDWLRSEGIEVLDLRPILRHQREPVFWRKDLHLNVRGNKRIAEALLERL